MSVSDATSVASAAATIFDSKDDEKEVSEVVNNTSNIIDNDVAGNNNNASYNIASKVDVFLMDNRDIMNQASRKIGTIAMEDRQFHSFFGAWKEIAKMVWNMLGEGGLCPEKSKPKHLLWALYFLKEYIREGPRCSAVRGLKGAINPKTMCKWMWLFLERIAKLVDIVVSFYV
jgi:hypothetical protein